MRRVTTSLILPILTIAIGCIFTAGCNRDSSSLVKSGNKFFDRGKYKESALLYRNALKKDAKNGEAYYRMGLASLKLQDIGGAAAMLRRAIDLQPANADAATKLADIYWMAYVSDPVKYKSLLPEVVDLSNALLKNDPKSFDGLRLAGYYSLAQRNMADAISKFEQANRVKPYQPELSLVLTQAYVASNRQEDAEKLAKEVIAREKTFIPMYDQLAVLYLSRNRQSDVEQLMKLKIANNPANEHVYLQLAAYYFATNRRTESDATLQRLLSNPKDFPLAHLSVGRFFFRAKDFDRARREFDEGLKTASSKDKVIYQKATVELLGYQNKASEARQIVNEILKDNPKDTQAIEMRSSLQIASGNQQEIGNAVNDLQSLVSKSGDNPSYRFQLGRALLAKGNVDQARVHLEEAVRLRPDLVGAKVLLARLLTAKNDHGRALTMADEVIRLDPNNLGAHLVRSSALIGMGEQAKAKEELDKIIKVAPNSTDAQFQLGLINYNEKNYKEADNVFRQMQAAAPGDPRGLVGVVETQVARHDFKAAIDQLEGELKKDPNRQDYMLALANVKVRAEQYDSAIKDFQTLTAKNPKSADLLTRLGETYRLKGDLNGAIDNFRKAIALDGSNTAPMLRLATLLEGIGRRGEAKPLYEQVLRVQPEEPVSLNNLAYIKAEEGTDLDEALRLAQKAKQKAPQDPNISDTLGWVYIKKNLSEDAVRIFRELTTKEPKNSTYRYHLAMALFQKGDRLGAVKECQVALQSNPTKDEQAKIQDLMQRLGATASGVVPAR